MTQRKSHLDVTSLSVLFLCCLFWGTQQVLIKATLPFMAPVFQASVRFLGATLLLMAWCFYKKIPLWQKDKSMWVGIIAGLLFALEFACLYTGLQYTSASRLTVFAYTAPFWVAFLVPIWVPSEKLNSIQWLGLILAFSGVILALLDGLVGSSSLHWQGDLLALLAGLSWGLTTVVIKTTVLNKLSPEKLLFYQVAMSAISLPFLSLALNEPWSMQMTYFSVSSLVIQTVLGAFISYLAWMWLLSRYPATKMSGFVFLTPVAAVMVGNLWLQEAITLALIGGLILVAIGMILVNRKAN